MVFSPIPWLFSLLYLTVIVVVVFSYCSFSFEVIELLPGCDRGVFIRRHVVCYSIHCSVSEEVMEFKGTVG